MEFSFYSTYKNKVLTSLIIYFKKKKNNMSCTKNMKIWTWGNSQIVYRIK